MNGSLNKTVIWQWNCRSFSNKKGDLLQFYQHSTIKPDIILLQEPNGKAKLPGFISYEDPTGRSTATLIKNNIAATHHITPQRGLEHTLTEVHPKSVNKHEGGLFILNCYCRPRAKKPWGLDDTFTEAIRLATAKPNSTLLIAGDFNAAHQTWGYHWNSARGKEIDSKWTKT